MDMTYPTAAGTDLSARALLVSATVRVWSGEKRDRAITREICAMKGAHDNSVRANKSLLGAAIRPVQAAERAVRDTVTRHTLGWMDDGTRILKGSSFLAFTAAMAAPVAAFDAAVDGFIGAYPEVKRQARERLGEAYAESDFPPQERLHGRFGVKLVFLPVPASDDFRVHLGAEEIAAVRRSAEDALRETVQNAVHDLLDRLREPVARMATRLRLFERDAGGKVTHPFRDSLVGNVRAIVRLAPALNLLDDPRIADLYEEIERLLACHEPEALRGSASLRDEVAGQAEAILRRMDGAFA